MAKQTQTKPPLRIIVVDVLKPHKPDIVELGGLICADKTVDIVNFSVYAVDEKTESVKMVLEGKSIDFEAIKQILDDHGAAIHSVDKVVVGKEKIVPIPRIVDHER